MIRSRVIFPILLAFLALGISLPASASAESSNPLAGALTASATSTTSTANCPSGNCFEEKAEWVPGTVITVSGGSASGGKSISAIIRETPVSKLKKIKKSYEKKYKVVVGYYQNPNGYQGPKSKCIDPTKVPRWHFHAGEFYKTTNHLREPVPPARWQKGDKICDWKEVKINGRWWVHGTQELCSNVESWIPITVKIRKPRRVYVQFQTVEKFYEVAIKRLEIKSEAEGGSGEGGGATFETPGHYQCKPGGQLNGNMCKYCPPPSSCEEKEPPTIKNVYKIQEVKTNEEIQFYSDLYAPSGDEVVLTFETEYGKFTPEKFVVPSYGAKSHFVTTYKAPSEALTDEVCVTALDKTTGKEAIPQCQLVEVQAVSEPPS